jgi:hypothetical protein
MVAGVRQIVVKNLYGGLDVNHSIFGNFSFAERLVSEQRSLGNPYLVTVLVAAEEAAVWDGSAAEPSPHDEPGGIESAAAIA